MSELFVAGDPRVLSGGALSPRQIDYSERPPKIPPSAAVLTTETMPEGSTSAVDAARRAGQNVHQGRVSYHDTPSYNLFLREGELPSAGVELETVLCVCDDSFKERAANELESNWFHMERDGSLDRAHSGRYGFELITEPLPPRAYRSVGLWTGLQNLVAPWLESYSHPETGLHVHVGLEQFEDVDEIPLKAKCDRRQLGSVVSAMVYYALAGQSLVDRVALRKAGSYCDTMQHDCFAAAAELASSGKARGADFVDLAVKSLLEYGSNSAYSNVSTSVLSRTGAIAYFSSSLSCGHDVEINMGHSYTIEFRRAKGTLNALSVHRIVEFMTSVVRFAHKLCRKPDTEATKEAFSGWLYQTTTSQALKTLIQKEGRMPTCAS